MPNVTLSGYLAAAIAVTWATGQALNSLTSTEWTDLSDEIDNSTLKYALADLFLDLAALTTTGTPVIEVYIVPSVDGAVYPTWTGNATADAPEQSHYLAAVLPLRVVTTTALRSVTPSHAPVELPNGKFKIGLRSRAGGNIAASGNTLYYRPHTVTV